MQTQGYDNWVSEYFYSIGKIESGLKKLSMAPENDSPLVDFSGDNHFRQILYIGISEFNQGLERICKLTIIANSILNGNKIPKTRKFGHSIKSLLSEINSFGIQQNIFKDIKLNINNLLDLLEAASESSSRYEFLEGVTDSSYSQSGNGTLINKWYLLLSNAKGVLHEIHEENEIISPDMLISLANNQEDLIVKISNALGVVLDVDGEALLRRDNEYYNYYQGAIYYKLSSFVAFNLALIAYPIFKIHDSLTSDLFHNQQSGDLLTIPYTSEIPKNFYINDYLSFISDYLMGIGDLEIFLEEYSKLVEFTEGQYL